MAGFTVKNRTSAFEKLKRTIWPRKSHARSAKYMTKRVLRIKATPYAIAMGVAAGCFASFTPFLGLHFIIALVIAYILRGSLLASALGTAVGNPLTFPAIWACTLGLGNTIMGDPKARSDGFVTAFMDQGVLAVWEPFLKPMVIGGVPLGLAAGAALFTITYFAVSKFQKRRAIAVKGIVAKAKSAAKAKNHKPLHARNAMAAGGR
ncbi:MAG: DUF2062 domain-containing protein [Pseudomonadota bacterium]